MKSVAEHLAEASMDGANIVLSAADCNTSSIHVVSISFDTTIRAIGAAQEEAHREGYKAGYIDGELFGIEQATTCIADFARREALEEALRLAESHPGNCNHKKNPFCCDDYARRLRALIDKEPKK